MKISLHIITTKTNIHQKFLGKLINSNKKKRRKKTNSNCRWHRKIKKTSVTMCLTLSFVFLFLFFYFIRKPSLSVINIFEEETRNAKFSRIRGELKQKSLSEYNIQ